MGPLRSGNRKHQPGAGEVAGVGDALAVVAGVAGLDVEHERVGVLGEPLVPGGVHDGEDIELDAAPDEVAPDGLARELLPEGVGGAVVHELVRAIEEAARAEAVDLVADAPVVEDGAAAKGAVGERDGDATDGVVDHLVPVDDAAGIGAGVSVDLHADDAILGADPGGGLLGVMKSGCSKGGCRPPSRHPRRSPGRRWCEASPDRGTRPCPPGCPR